MALVAAAALAAMLAGNALAVWDKAWWIEYLPLILFLLAALVGSRMNHARVTFLALVGIFSFLAVVHHGDEEHAQRATALVAGLAICGYTLLCVHWRERGIATEMGALRLLAIAGPLAVFWGIAAAHPASLAVLVPRFLQPAAGHLLPLPWPVVLAAIGAAGLLVAWRHRHPLETPIVLSCLVAMLLAVAVTSPRFFAWQPGEALAVRIAAGRVASSLFMGAAALILLFATLEHSYGSAFIDELTGIPGRRALDQRLSSLGSRFALAMIDLDHFKQVNDRHGHAVGDQALRFVARHLHDVDEGTAYRYGGEEFVVVLPRRTEQRAYAILENVRVGIAEAEFRLRGPDPAAASARQEPPAAPPERVPLTVSIGIAAVSRGELTPEEALAEADRALYRAKDLGRNRTVRRSECTPADTPMQEG